MRGSIESLGMQGKQSFPKFANMGKSHINQTQPSNSPTQQNSRKKKCQPSSHLCQPSEQADSPSARAALPHPQGRRLCHRKKIQEGGLFQFISGTCIILKSNFFGVHFGSKKRVKMWRNSWWINESRFMSIKFSPPINHTHLDKNPQVFLIFNHPTTEKKTTPPKIQNPETSSSKKPLCLSFLNFKANDLPWPGGKDRWFLDRGLRLDHFFWFQEHLLPELIGF